MHCSKSFQGKEHILIKGTFCIMCFQSPPKAMFAVAFLLDGALMRGKDLTRLLTRFLSVTWMGLTEPRFIVPMLLWPHMLYCLDSDY